MEEPPIGSRITPLPTKVPLETRLEQMREAARRSSDRFPTAARALGEDARLIFRDLSRIVSVPNQHELTIYFVAVTGSELVEVKNDYARQRIGDQPTDPPWLQEGELWTIDAGTINNRKRRSIYSSAPSGQRRTFIAELLQEIAVETFGITWPECPLHGHLLGATELNGEAVWVCPSTSWRCLVGEYEG
jgi:hypothetical protein